MSALDDVLNKESLSQLNTQELNELAEDLRAEMIAATSLNGGHLASSLGAVELIIAAHRVLDLPHDKLLFDVGHQAYAHKMLTGRLGGFSQLRQSGGVSGFTRRNESVFDVHDSGHASDAVATAAGIATARDYLGGDEKIVTIVGDASIAGGLSFEALNYAGQAQLKKFVVILNDNEMSIAPSVGALSSYLAYLRTNPHYTNTRDQLEAHLASTGHIGDILVRLGERAKQATKTFFVPGMLFEEFGFTYLGPINGHDIHSVEDTLIRGLSLDCPVLIHAITQKGKGFEPAEKNPEIFHGVGPFDAKTGELLKKSSSNPTCTQVFAETLLEEAKKDESIVAITAAMPDGTGLALLRDKMPKRFFDVGIAEECAVTLASGMAIQGLTPVVAIYSTFLQRAYDEISTNICLPQHHVIFAVDRAGLVGEDGSTHHGMFDIAYLRTLPHMRIIAPSNSDELKNALKFALKLDGPVAIRYPRGSLPMAQESQQEPFNFLAREAWTSLEDTSLIPQITVLALGKMVNVAIEACKTIAQTYSVSVIDMRWAKPIDTEAVKRACQSKLVVTLEDGTKEGGFGSGVLEEISDSGRNANTLILGLPADYISHGSLNDLYRQCGIDSQGVADSILERASSLIDNGSDK
ncbi:MAG: 1-deoxy-D-xylulose-5-phosphate synthase [Coriobacteriales bacterium]|nr:1-deoxy-D-xylulose-5-phosphate synthase [Coriobacteriales bacterium]